MFLYYICLFKFFNGEVYFEEKDFLGLLVCIIRSLKYCFIFLKNIFMDCFIDVEMCS